MQHFFWNMHIVAVNVFIIEKITSLCADSFHKLEEIFFRNMMMWTSNPTP